MADPDRAVALDLLFFAPLPFLSDGRRVHQLGVSIFYAELLPRLAAAGHRVRGVAEAPPPSAGERRAGLWPPVAPVAPVEQGGRSPVGLEAPRVEVDWFAFDYRSGRLPADQAFCETTRAQLAPRLARLLEAGRPDLVVCGREILAPPILALCRQHALPCAVIAHGVTLAAAAGADYPAAARQVLSESLRGADRVIAVARHLEASLRAIGVERACTIANGADSERFCPAPRDARLLADWGIGADQVVVALVGSLKAPKRPRDLLLAAAALAAEGVVYVVVGDGPLRAELEAEVGATGLAEAFRFVGEVEHARMPVVMRLADIVVLASEREGHPLIYGEAQASGRVVLASDIPAAREAIEDGETGVLFRMGDPASLAAALRALVGDRPRRERIGRKARAAAEAWSAEAVARAYAAEFGRVVAEAGPS